MPATRPMKEVLAARATASFVGRRRELSLLMECATGTIPGIAWVHGVAGIGKTALLQQFSAGAVAQGCTVLSLDCRFVEPTPGAFISALQKIVAVPVDTEESATEALSVFERCVLVLDGYEVFRLLDSWIRQVFAPALTDNVRLVLCGRYGPGPGWQAAPEWRGLIRPIELCPLSDSDSLAVLETVGLTAEQAVKIHGVARGHPMALVLGAFHAVAAGPDVQRMDSAGLVQQLMQNYMSEVPNRDLRTAVEACSVVRRTTRSLLKAMLADLYSPDLYEQLAELSIVQATSEGLMMHEQVQDAVAAWLRNSDPERFRNYRRTAWGQLRTESASADRQDWWRYTADMLYLLQNPHVREAFFPSGSQMLSPELARFEDVEAIFSIADSHETRAGAAAIRLWWQKSPECFHVLRNGRGDVAGFYVLAEWPAIRSKLPELDPVAHSWRRHLSDRPMEKNESALFIRRWLSDTAGESPSPVQAACWTDVKRSYLRLRPHVRRCYVSVGDLATYGPPTSQVGFQVVPEASVSLDGIQHHLAVLDFGPGSIDHWLTGLVARELGVKQEEYFDEDARELVLDDARIGLTALESGVLRYLNERSGKAVSRAELLEHVWQQRPDSGSNVVDVVVRSLRSKLRDRARMISTVRGVGYRIHAGQSDT